MKTVSPLKPTSLFLVLNLAPQRGRTRPPNCGAAPPDPGEAAPPLLWRQALPALGGSPTLLHTKRKKEFLFLVVVVGGCGYVGEVG